MSWETHPLYVLLHESIYTQGPATKWAAHTVLEESHKNLFDPKTAVEENRPIYFVGEMVFPWMFDDFKELRPLKETAEIIANTIDWPRLYDLSVLEQNSIPVASATYFEVQNHETSQRNVLLGHLCGF